MGLTQILGMFDKVDDIIYEPVKVISRWLEAPLEGIKMKRLEKDREHAAELAVTVRRQNAEIDAEIKKLNAELKNENRDKMVNSLKNYQTTLANASIEIVNNMGKLNRELRKEAQALVRENIKAYEEDQKNYWERLHQMLESAEPYREKDPKQYEKLKDMANDCYIKMFDLSAEFISELKDDIKRFGDYVDDAGREYTEFIKTILTPFAQEISQSGIEIEMTEVQPALKDNTGYLTTKND